MSDFTFDFDTAADEDFFGNLRNKSSKLQQLLDDDTLPEAEKQQSLKYQRPKASDLKKIQKNENQTAKAVSGSVTLIAKVATAYSQGKLQGKVGVALAELSPDCLQLVVYKTRENVLASLQMQSQSQSLFKQQRYWQFYDDTSKVDWSFCFEIKQDENEFQDLLTKKGQTFQETKESNEDSGGGAKISSIDLTNIEDSPKDFNSISTSEAKGPSKSVLIKRVAKMGQALPNLPNNNALQTTTEFSDSSDTEVIKTPLSQKPSIAPRRDKLSAIKNQQNQIMPTSSMAISASAPIYAAISNNLEAQYMQMLLTEQRTQGSELRMNVQKIETKIEKVLDKLDYMERGSGTEFKEKRHKDDEILELEEKILNLKKENRKLKQIIEETPKRETYEQHNEKMLEKYKKDLELLELTEFSDMENILKKCLRRLKDNHGNMEQLKAVKEELESQNNTMEKELKSMRELKELQKNQIKELEDKDSVNKLNVEEHLKTIKNLEQKVQELQQNLDTISQEKSEPTTDSVVKNIMNNLYSNICSRITPNDCEDVDRVLSLVGLAIKQQTLKALQKP